MKKIATVLFVGILMTAAALVISAGDVLFEDGGLNISDDLLVNTNTLYVDSTNNKVGIGTSSPSAELEVVGNITQDDNYYKCYGTDCDAHIHYNGSSLIIKVN